MADEVTYHSSHCRGLLVDQSTGELKYNKTGFYPYSDMPLVAQFIGAKPISEDCESFSIVRVRDLNHKVYHFGTTCIHPHFNEIVNSMTESLNIGIGLCHKKYDPERMAGCDNNSIGYHADDGGIYHDFPYPKDECRFGHVEAGEVMKCSFDFHEKNVTFLRNGIQVFTSIPLHIPPGGYYPMVCLGSNGQIVRLLETQPWLPDTEIGPLSNNLVFHSLYCREAQISHVSGIVRDRQSRTEVVHRIGVCHRCYPSNCQPGWLPNSIAYHVDDGGIYHENGMTLCEGPKARSGDILSCEIDFSTMTCIFQQNDITIYRSPPMTIPPGGFHAAVGFHSPGEAVCLLEKEPWKSEIQELSENPSTPNCCICADKGVTRFLIPCGHTFCVDCIEEWLTHHTTCPVCRAGYQDVKKLYF